MSGFTEFKLKGVKRKERWFLDWQDQIWVLELGFGPDLGLEGSCIDLGSETMKQEETSFNFLLLT